MENNIIELPIKEILSYSRIDTFKQCPMRYKLKYIEKNYTDTTSLALQIGTLCHFANELKYGTNNKVALDNIWSGVESGFDIKEVSVGKDGKETEKVSHLKGLNELIDEYGFDYYEINAKSGMSVEDKIIVFKETFYTETIEDDWEVVGLEKDFEITFNNKAKIKGFIDRIDRNKITGDIRVLDYKTNNKLFDKKDIVSSMQMYIYSLACQEMYGKLPTECIYDMLFFNEKQQAFSKGWENRCFKALNKLLDGIIYYQDLGKEYMPPSACPLCNWCPYSATNPEAQEPENKLCEYYSNWTRDNKTFSVNKKWIEPSSDDDDWDSWD